MHYVLYRYGDDSVNFALEHYPGEGLAQGRVWQHLKKRLDTNAKDWDDTEVDTLTELVEAKEDVKAALESFHFIDGQLDLIDWGPVNVLEFLPQD